MLEPRMSIRSSTIKLHIDKRQKQRWSLRYGSSSKGFSKVQLKKREIHDKFIARHIIASHSIAYLSWACPPLHATFATHNQQQCYTLKHQQQHVHVSSYITCKRTQQRAQKPIMQSRQSSVLSGHFAGHYTEQVATIYHAHRHKTFLSKHGNLQLHVPWWGTICDEGHPR